MLTRQTKEKSFLGQKIGRRSFLKCTVAAMVTATGLLTFPNVLIASQKEVKFGVMYPLSGGIAQIGLYLKQGVQMACDDINAAGGIKSLGGAKLVPVFADTEGKPEVGMTAAEKLIQEGVSALIGCYQSSVTFATTQVAEKYQIPHIVDVAVSDEITERGFRYTFRTTVMSSLHSRDQTGFFKYMGEKTGVKPKTAALIYENTLFGKTSAKYQKAAAEAAGLKIVEDISYPHDTLDLTTEISRLKAGKPDVVYRTAYINEAILITRTMHELKFYCMGEVGIAGETAPRYIEALGALTNGVFTSEAWNPGLKVPGAAETSGRYKKRFGVMMESNAAQAHAAVYIFKEALEIARSSDRSAIRDALKKVDIGGGEKGNIMPYGIKFDEKGQNMKGFLSIIQIQNGVPQPVHPEIIATKKPIWPAPKTF